MNKDNHIVEMKK